MTISLRKMYILPLLAVVLAGCPDRNWGGRKAEPYSAYYSVTSLEGPRDTCIVTQYTSNMDEYASIAADNHQAYAHRHGYRAYAFRGRISGERFSDPSHHERLWRDGLYWQKIDAVQRLLSLQDPATGGEACHWVMWLDADAIFTNFERSIEDVLRPWADKDVVLSREYMDTIINAGVFFVKNTEAGRGFMQAVADNYEDYKDTDLPEQSAIQDLAFQTMLPRNHAGLFDRVKSRVLPEVAVAPQRTFDSFSPVTTSTHNALWTWEPCDFVAHIAATRTDVRVEVMHDMIDNRPVCDH